MGKLAIYFNKNIDLNNLKEYIENHYEDKFFITGDISLNDTFHTGSVHYTEIRMRGVDVLITDIRDIDKVKSFNNRIMLYFCSESNISNIDYKKTLSLIGHVDKILLDKKIDKKIIEHLFHFNSEKVHYV